MLLSSLLLIPVLGIFLIYSTTSYEKLVLNNTTFHVNNTTQQGNNTNYKIITLGTSIINLIISLIIYISFDFSSNQFQFVSSLSDMSFYCLDIGVDGLSIYFVLLTTFIVPVTLISSWNSINRDVRTFTVLILLLETLLLGTFVALDLLLFYICFESILPALFLLVGLFGSVNRVRAGYYLFLYTLGSSLFMLLPILTISSIAGSACFDVVNKINLGLSLQIVLFTGIFIAIGVKTPLYGLNSWLLKAHVESPLGGSIILAAIVLKLALYGIFRLLLPILPEACLFVAPFIFVYGVITIVYAAFSTLRTTDIKKLIAYSSVGHASIYLTGALSNTIQGIEGAILLGLGHGLVSSGLFIIVGGILYDRIGTRNIAFYSGLAQTTPLFSIFFFIFILANCGTPLTLNFPGEFLSLYGSVERLPVTGALACSSVFLSAGYSIYFYNRVVFGGSSSRFLEESISDLTKREFFLLWVLVSFTGLSGVYPSFILDGLHYNVSILIYNYMDLSQGLALTFLIFRPSELALASSGGGGGS